MNMNLKTHTGYPEIVIGEMFDYINGDDKGRVETPLAAPSDSTVTKVCPWVAKIIGQPPTSFEDFVEGGYKPEDFKAPILEEFSGEAGSHEDAKQKALAALTKANVEDKYLRPIADKEEVTLAPNDVDSVTLEGEV